MPDGLQLIIGADTKNNFTIYKDKRENTIHVYFGLGLFEIVDATKNNPELKLLLARLYNSGVKVKTLIEHFGYSYPTYKLWGDALKSGDKEKLYYAISGREARKKLTPVIVAFIIHDFQLIYARNKYSYSKEIRRDVKDIYNIEVSSECIRPILSKLKEAFNEKQKLSEVQKKRIFKSYMG